MKGLQWQLARVNPIAGEVVMPQGMYKTILVITVTKTRKRMQAITMTSKQFLLLTTSQKSCYALLAPLESKQLAVI